MTNELICMKCKHFRALSGGCDAFPKGIPYEISSSREDLHEKPTKEQENDIVFSPFKNESEQLK